MELCGFTDLVVQLARLRGGKADNGKQYDEANCCRPHLLTVMLSYVRKEVLVLKVASTLAFF